MAARHNGLAAAALLALACSAAARAHDFMALDELVGAFGWDFEATPVRVEPVREGLYALFGVGGNIGALLGPDGVLLVDDQFPQFMPKIDAALAELGHDRIDYAINTHWHFDHADGNLALGPRGTTLVAQSNSRRMLLEDQEVNLVSMQYRQPAYPSAALPAVTYDEAMQLHFNGETIELMHFGPAHTTGDSAVFFRNHNVVHTGDTFISGGYPFIDADNGGDLDDLIHFSRSVLALCDEDTVVIPGHGELSDAAGLRDWIAMLETVRGRLQTLIDEGASLDDVLAAAPTADYDETLGEPTLFVNRAYTTLTRGTRGADG